MDVKATRKDLELELAALGEPDRAKSSAWFFKTGKGQYGEGDRFLGVRVPLQRKVAHRYLHLPGKEIARLLRSPIHEHRFTAAEILVAQYERASEKESQEIFNFYLAEARRFNNWDLVDTSAPYIVGRHLQTRPRSVLYRLAKSENIWERRIAIVSTLTFAKQQDVEDVFGIAAVLLRDKHDLIHKAVGWALREAGRVSRTRLLAFLRGHYQEVPRTTLRYAIEHLPGGERQRILAGEFPNAPQ